LEDTGATPEDFVMQSLSMDLERLMADLTPQQREVLACAWSRGWASVTRQIGDRSSVVNGCGRSSAKP